MADEPDYVHGHHASVLRSHSWRTAENSAAYLIPVLRPGMRLLDVGCGPGTLTADLGARVRPGVTVGVDREPGVLVEAARAIGAAGDAAEGPTLLQVGDAYGLAFPNGTFDVVHAHQVLQHLADPVGALAEWRRVCRPGGLVAARDADYAAMTWHPADPWLDRWLVTYDRLARQAGGEPDAGRHLLAWAHRAGFSEIRASASVWCFATPSERAWWGGLWAERVEHSRFADRALADGQATSDEIAAMAAAWRRWAAHDDGWFAVLHGEIVATA